MPKIIVDFVAQKKTWFDFVYVFDLGFKITADCCIFVGFIG